jgi:hypothetical protein
MPVYEALCKKCGQYQDYYQSIANCRDTPECCGEKTEKVIRTAPYGLVDIPAYVSPVSGRLINSRADRREDFKRTDCRPWEGMEQETKAAQERAKDEEKKADAKLEEAVVSAWHQIAPEKRKALEQEV